MLWQPIWLPKSEHRFSPRTHCGQGGTCHSFRGVWTRHSWISHIQVLDPSHAFGSFGKYPDPQEREEKEASFWICFLERFSFALFQTPVIYRSAHTQNQPRKATRIQRLVCTALDQSLLNCEKQHFCRLLLLKELLGLSGNLWGIVCLGVNLLRTIYNFTLLVSLSAGSLKQSKQRRSSKPQRDMQRGQKSYLTIRIHSWNRAKYSY